MEPVTEKTPAEQLRAAAAKLRERANSTSPVPWVANDALRLDDGSLRIDIIGVRTPVAEVHVMAEAAVWPHLVHEAKGDAAWIALAHPGLAEPLAAWLESAALDYDSRGGAPAGASDSPAMRIAGILLGGDRG